MSIRFFRCRSSLFALGIAVKHSSAFNYWGVAMPPTITLCIELGLHRLAFKFNLSNPTT